MRILGYLAWSGLVPGSVDVDDGAENAFPFRLCPVDGKSSLPVSRGEKESVMTEKIKSRIENSRNF
jgi:hypothetical protein